MRSQKNLGTLSISKRNMNYSTGTLRERSILCSLKAETSILGNLLRILSVITIPAALLYATYLIELSRFQGVQDLCMSSCNADVRQYNCRAQEKSMVFALSTYLSHCKIACEDKLSSGRQKSEWVRLASIGILLWFSVCAVAAILIRQRLLSGQ